MVWDIRLRRLSWVFFLLMWIPFAFTFYTAFTDGKMEVIGIYMGLIFLFCILFAVLLVGSFFIGRREKERIKRTGIPAKATILQVQGTGTRVNDQPLVKIELEVQPPYDSRFTATVEYIVPVYYDLSQLQPGTTVQVYYIDGTDEVALADL